MSFTVWADMPADRAERFLADEIKAWEDAEAAVITAGAL